MEEGYKTAMVILIILIIGMAVAIAIIILLWKRDKKKFNEEAEARYKAGKEDAADIMRMTIDKIQDDRGKLSAMQEKELLIEIMLSLGSYGRRLDRIEDKMGSLTNYKAYIASMNEQVQSLINNILDLQKNVSDSGEQVGNFKAAIVEVSDHVTKANTSLEQAGDIGRKSDEIITKLQNTIDFMTNINSQANVVAEKSANFFKDFSESPTEMFNTLRLSVEDINNSLNSIRNDISSLDNEVDSITMSLSDMEDVKSNIDQVKSIVDATLSDYGYNSIYSEIRDIKSDVDDLKSTVNSAFDHYSYDSIFSKLDDIENKLNS